MVWVICKGTGQAYFRHPAQRAAWGLTRVVPAPVNYVFVFICSVYVCFMNHLGVLYFVLMKLYLYFCANFKIYLIMSDIANKVKSIIVDKLGVDEK